MYPLVQEEVQLIINEEIFTEGVEIMFTCPPDFLLSGADTSTCMEDGQWLPNPSQVECRGKCDTYVPE